MTCNARAAFAPSLAVAVVVALAFAAMATQGYMVVDWLSLSGRYSTTLMGDFSAQPLEADRNLKLQHTMNRSSSK